MKKVLLIGLVLVTGCASSMKSANQRVVIENSLRGEDMPAWVISPKISWPEADDLRFKSTYTISGNQRINGCYDLAKLDLKETLLSELSQDIKGEINLADEGISEGLDPLMTKSIRTNIEGQMRGLKIVEQLFERYSINQVERVDCFVQGAISKVDYMKLKNSVIKNMSAVNAVVAEAVRKRQSEFFEEKSK